MRYLRGGHTLLPWYTMWVPKQLVSERLNILCKFIVIHRSKETYSCSNFHILLYVDVFETPHWYQAIECIRSEFLWEAEMVDWVGVSLTDDEMGWWGSLKNLFKNNFEKGAGKSKNCSWGRD